MDIINKDQVSNWLDEAYSKILDGELGGKSCKQIADEYIKKYNDKKVAAKNFISGQVSKCALSGFVTNMGGFVTLPITLPANIISVLYMQLKMIIVTAYIGGLDGNDEQVKTMCLMCLVKGSCGEILKDAGVQVVNKITYSMLSRMPKEVLGKINQKVGFYLFTRFGSKATIRIANLVPIVGGVIGAGIDGIGTNIVADRAYRIFILNDIS